MRFVHGIQTNAFRSAIHSRKNKMHSSKRKACVASLSCQRGSALVMVMIFSAIILVIAAASVALVSFQGRQLGRSVAYKQALAMAEAGADRAVAQMNVSGNTWSGWTTSGSNRVLKDQVMKDASGTKIGSFSVTVINATSSSPRIDSTGTAQNGDTGIVKRRIVIPVKGNTTPSFFGPYGVYSTGSITVNSNASTDGYDSSLGPYGSGNKGLDNSMAAVKNISLGSNCTVGNVQAGGSVSDDNGHAHYTSLSRNNMPTSPPPFPDAELAAAKAANDNSKIQVYEFKNNAETLKQDGIPANGVFNFNNLNVNGTMRIKIPAGTYYLNKLEINSNADIMISGPVKIYMDPGSGQTAIQMNSNTSINAIGTNPLPANCEFFIKSGSVNFNSNFTIYAGIFAPNSVFQNFNSKTYLYGAIVGSDIGMNSNAHIYTDKSMLQPASSSGYMAQAWSELPATS